jgi:hypothetical protein
MGIIKKPEFFGKGSGGKAFFPRKGFPRINLKNYA